MICDAPVSDAEIGAIIAGRKDGESIFLQIAYQKELQTDPYNSTLQTGFLHAWAPNRSRPN
jgi:hypothetical protein